MKRLIFASVLLLVSAGFAQFAQAQVIDEPPPQDGAWTRENTSQLEPVPYVYVREADVFWGTRIWRTIDLREKINHPLYFPLSPTNGRINLMTVIFNGLKENAIKAYSVENDYFTVPMTYDEIMAKVERVDTIKATRPFPPYEEYDTVISQPFDFGSVQMIRLKEDWYFDKERSMMEARVLGICPVTIEYDNSGEFKGFRPLFWIYFPEARKLFAKYEVFNRFNDTERRSYDDVFFKRMFGSYIYKESNVYDRPISDYAVNMDALLESERIREQIFIREHDLWEY
jgi:gliding motility associated protien GldN